MKGSITDTIYLVTGLFAFCLILFIGYYISDTLYTDLSANPEINATALEKSTDALAGFDDLILLVIAGTLMASLIFAWYIESHPAFLGISIIMFMISVVTSAIFSNMFLTITSGSAFASATAEFTTIGWVFANLPAIVTVFGILILIVMFSKIIGQRSGV